LLKDSRETIRHTGASGGTVRISKALLEKDSSVVVISRSASQSPALKASGTLVVVDGDISNKATPVKIAEVAIRHFDRIDLLVNNAGNDNIRRRTNLISWLFRQQACSSGFAIAVRLSATREHLSDGIQHNLRFDSGLSTGHWDGFDLSSAV
jgi:NAD(P)-dependent dehydrogenase (short-subunit alcohol dehydrogenase family)